MKPFNEESAPIMNMKLSLETHIKNAISDGFEIFYSGVARGLDIIASEIVIELKQQYKHIKHFAVIPYEGQADRWPEQWQKRYSNVLANSDGKLVLSGEYYKGCLHERNAFMVENSTRVIAVYTGGKGGTYNTIQLAKKANKEIIFLTL